jgi:hypothetical protein
LLGELLDRLNNGLFCSLLARRKTCFELRNERNPRAIANFKLVEAAGLQNPFSAEQSEPLAWRLDFSGDSPAQFFHRRGGV